MQENFRKDRKCPYLKPIKNSKFECDSDTFKKLSVTDDLPCQESKRILEPDFRVKHVEVVMKDYSELFCLELGHHRNVGMMFLYSGFINLKMAESPGDSHVAARSIRVQRFNKGLFPGVNNAKE